MRRIAYLLGVVALLAVGGAVSTANAGDEAHKVFVCKYVGTPGVDERLQTGDNPIDVDIASIPDYHGVGSYFADAQGRSFVLGPEHSASEQVDEPSIDNCPQPEGPPTDVCPNLEGNQSELPPGYHFAEDENGRTVCVQNPPPTDVCPNLEGNQEELPDGYVLVDGQCVQLPPPDVCPNIAGIQEQVPAGLIVVNGQCVTPPPFFPVGAATVICDNHVYRFSGTVDGQAADSVSPATLPGNTRGVVEVVVTRGDTSVRTVVGLNGDCAPTNVVPPPVTTEVTSPATTPPPAAKPPTAKPPTRKPTAKPKPKPKPKKAASKPKPNKKPKKAPKTLSLG